MNDYISREEAQKVLCDACGNAACPRGLIPRCSFYEKMQSIPAADVRPVRWIPVTERLPEDFQKVLVFWREHSEPMIDTAFWQKDAKQFDGEHWVNLEDKVTHWMPLPEKPKEET